MTVYTKKIIKLRQKNTLLRPNVSFIQIRDSNSSLNGLLCDFIHYQFYAVFVFVLCRVHFNHVFVEWCARILQLISNLELSRYSIIWRYNNFRLWNIYNTYLKTFYRWTIASLKLPDFIICRKVSRSRYSIISTMPKLCKPIKSIINIKDFIPPILNWMFSIISRGNWFFYIPYKRFSTHPPCNALK